MKKQLLTTTALVLAGALAVSGSAFAQKKKASKPKLSVGGGQTYIVGVADNEDNAISDRVGVDVLVSSEVHFKTNHTLDNGIKLVGRLEFEAATETDQIDEAWMAVRGAFGEIKIGSEDNAPHLMVTPYMGHWAANVGMNLTFDTGDWLATPSGFQRDLSSRLDIGDRDSEKISYFTPRIEGRQVGVTYMPSFEEDTNSSISPKANREHEGFAVGVNYIRKIDKIGIGLAAGYATINQQSGTSTPETNQNDPKGYNLGARITFEGFRVAVGYKNEANLNSGPTTSADGEIFDSAVRYIWGANAVSVSYLTSESEAVKSVAGDDETDVVLVAYRRTLGPGVIWNVSVVHADMDGEDTTTTSDDADGWALTTGIKLSF